MSPPSSTASGAPSPTTDRDKEPPMSQQSINAPGPGEDEPVGEDAATGGQTFASAQAADDLLDEIDEVLESRSEERRVGKEWRSWMWVEQGKRKTEGEENRRKQKSGTEVPGRG